MEGTHENVVKANEKFKDKATAEVLANGHNVKKIKNHEQRFNQFGHCPAKY
ncbi:MAG: hypothetical protein WCP32_18575, partial [Bacteroidota bacterium]